MLPRNKKEQKILTDATTWWISGELCKWNTSQPQKVTYCIILFIQHSWNSKIIQMEKRLGDFQSCGGGRRKKTWLLKCNMRDSEWWKAYLSWLYWCQYPGCVPYYSFSNTNTEVLGGNPQTNKPWSCPASRQKKKPRDRGRDIYWIGDLSRLKPRVLEQYSTIYSRWQAGHGSNFCFFLERGYQ